MHNFFKSYYKEFLWPLDTYQILKGEWPQILTFGFFIVHTMYAPLAYITHLTDSSAFSKFACIERGGDGIIILNPSGHQLEL